MRERKEIWGPCFNLLFWSSCLHLSFPSLVPISCSHLLFPSLVPSSWSQLSFPAPVRSSQALVPSNSIHFSTMMEFAVLCRKRGETPTKCEKLGIDCKKVVFSLIFKSLVQFQFRAAANTLAALGSKLLLWIEIVLWTWKCGRKTTLFAINK